MAPPTAFAIRCFVAYRHLGPLDTRIGPVIIIIYLTFDLSIVVWLTRPFCETAPRALEEAAWIDGAGFRHALVRVVLPSAAPGLVAAAILCFVFSIAVRRFLVSGLRAGAVKG